MTITQPKSDKTKFLKFTFSDESFELNDGELYGIDFDKSNDIVIISPHTLTPINIFLKMSLDNSRNLKFTSFLEKVKKQSSGKILHYDITIDDVKNELHFKIELSSIKFLETKIHVSI